MTESEAKTKWCPMANIAAVGSHGYNRDTISDPASKSFCIADACMMWRWIEVGVTEVSKVNEKHPEWTGQQCYDSIPLRGYCGLGGKP